RIVLERGRPAGPSRGPPGRPGVSEARLAPMDPAGLHRILAAAGESGTLPAATYTSHEVLSWEMEHFFEGGWLCVGRASDLGEPGDQRAVGVGSEGVILTRDHHRILRGFYNSCRHRGHELLDRGTQKVNRRVLRCPYHAWIYGLDGANRGTPRFGDVPGFDHERFP